MSEVRTIFLRIVLCSDTVSFTVKLTVAVTAMLLTITVSVIPAEDPVPEDPPFFPLGALYVPRDDTSGPPYSQVDTRVTTAEVTAVRISGVPRAPRPVFIEDSANIVYPPEDVVGTPRAVPVEDAAGALVPVVPPVDAEACKGVYVE